MQSPSARLKRPRTKSKLEIIMPCKMCGYKDSRFFRSKTAVTSRLFLGLLLVLLGQQDSLDVR